MRIYPNISESYIQEFLERKAEFQPDNYQRFVTHSVPTLTINGDVERVFPLAFPDGNSQYMDVYAKKNRLSNNLLVVNDNELYFCTAYNLTTIEKVDGLQWDSTDLHCIGMIFDQNLRGGDKEYRSFSPEIFNENVYAALNPERFVDALYYRRLQREKDPTDGKIGDHFIQGLANWYEMQDRPSLLNDYVSEEILAKRDGEVEGITVEVLLSNLTNKHSS